MIRRGISPAIASIFLIGVAVAGSLMAGNAMFQQNEISYKSTRIDVIDASLVSLGTSKTYFAYAIKNTGTTALTSVNIRLIDDAGNFHTFTDRRVLEPGEQFGGYAIEDLDVVPGRKYVFHIEGVSSTGSTYQGSRILVAR